VAQKLQGNVTIYTISSTDAQTHERTTEIFKADGRPVIKTERDPDSGVTIKQTMTVTCNGQILTAKFLVTFQNQVLSNLTSTMKKENNKLIQKLSGNVLDSSMNETMICE
jgi:hypothetical protein